MSREFQFTPIATVTVDDDGNATLEIDWSQSSQGEWDEASTDHVLNEATERVCAFLDSYVKGQLTINLGKLAEPLPDAGIPYGY